MRLYSRTFNKKVELLSFVNEAGIAKEDIVTVFQDKDGTYTIMYYGAE